MTRDNKIWLLTLTVWALGIIPIYWLWNLHFANDLIDLIYGFILYIVAFCYFVLLGPISEFIRRHIFTRT